MTLKVIGAGLGRTGTTSLKEALSMLLGGPCFHFLEYKAHPELMSEWLSFTEDVPKYTAVDSSVSVSASQWEHLLPDYVACVDEPACYYWKQLWEAYPDALVLLSVRDPVTWWESIKSITRQIKEEKNHPEGMTQARREFLEFLYALYPHLDDEEELSMEEDIEFFEEHNGKVLSFADQNERFKQRLLVWRTGDGWGPICQALKLPVPDVPFPHSNRRSEYHGY
jgi:hypothetical protein